MSDAAPDICMALAEFLKEPAPAPAASLEAKPADPAAKLRKQVFLEFGAMVALGLLLAGWYVAYRIVAGRTGARVSQPAKITFAQPVVVPAPKVVSQPPPAAESKPALPVAGAIAKSEPPPLLHAESKPALPVAEPVAKSGPPAPPHTESKPALPVAAAIAKSEPPPPHAESKPAPQVTAPFAKSGPPAPALTHETKTSALPAPLTKVPVASLPVSAQPEPAPPPVKRNEATVQQPFKRRGLTPRAGDKYLQIAAYGPRSLDDYLKTLEKQGMRPLVGPGPAENIYRILIGPLPNAEALEQTRHLIQSLGIEPILRSY